MPEPYEGFTKALAEEELETKEESRSLIKRMMQQRGLTFRELRDKNIIRCEEAFGHPVETWSINDWAVATLGEAGEAIEKFGKILSLLNKTKKIRRAEDGVLHPDVAVLVVEIMEEIADIVIYADLFMSRLGGDLESQVVMKFNRVSDKMGSDIKF